MPSMARSRVHPHLHRRRWLESCDTFFLVDLTHICLLRRSLLRLEELVGDVLLERWRALPPAQLDPEPERLRPR